VGLLRLSFDYSLPDPVCPGGATQVLLDVRDLDPGKFRAGEQVFAPLLPVLEPGCEQLFFECTIAAIPGHQPGQLVNRFVHQGRGPVFVAHPPFHVGPGEQEVNPAKVTLQVSEGFGLYHVLQRLPDRFHPDQGFLDLARLGLYFRREKLAREVSEAVIDIGGLDHGQLSQYLLRLEIAVHRETGQTDLGRHVAHASQGPGVIQLELCVPRGGFDFLRRDFDAFLPRDERIAQVADQQLGVGQPGQGRTQFALCA
jgi:hypothetical protein